MTRKSIQTNGPVIACEVCGRTLLRGEHADVFLHGGTRRMVCELCTARAVHEGWIREGLDGATVRSRGEGRRRGSFLQRLRSLRPEPQPHQQPPAAAPGRGYEHEPEWDEDEALAAAVADGHHQGEPPAEWSAGPPARPTAPRETHHAPHVSRETHHAPHASHQPREPRESRNVYAVPTNADLKMARALDLFNGSAHRRTVSGVARSLGEPIVSVRPSATEGSVVTIVVAWELSWYRFEVDLADEAAGVRVVAQGAELDELDEVEQEPNAAADDAGALHLASRHA